MGDTFMKWRRSADDCLIRLYKERFGVTPAKRPFFALLGEFDKTLTMFRDGQKVRFDVSEFEEFEITFMYPDHSHLTKEYNQSVPHLFFQRRDLEGAHFWGKLYTYKELQENYVTDGIGHYIQRYLNADGWAGCYVEAHVWKPVT